MSKEFSSKKVLVVGSSGGIGSRVAESFLELGGEVILHGRNAKKLSQKRKELENKFSKDIFSVVSDITKEGGRKKIVSDVTKIFGNKLDILVVCVGNGNVPKTSNISEKVWADVFNQNFFSIVLLVSKLIPILKKSKHASIVVIGSIAGIEYIGAPTSYAAAKAALNSYAKHLSVEYAKDNIRVNIVNPGNVYFPGGRWEELSKEDPKKVKEHINKAVPQGRFGTPDEIAQAIVFLSSSKAKFITGSSLVVDGGQHNSF